MPLDTCLCITSRILMLSKAGRTLRNKNFCFLWEFKWYLYVGRQSFLQNFTYVLSIWYRNHIPEYLAKDIENLSTHKKTTIFREAYFITVNLKGAKIFFTIQMNRVYGGFLIVFHRLMYLNTQWPDGRDFWRVFKTFLVMRLR